MEGPDSGTTAGPRKRLAGHGNNITRDNTMNKILALDPSILPSPIKPGGSSCGDGRPWARTLCAALLALSVGQAAEAAPGDLDASFDGDGRVLTPFGAIDSVAPGSQEFASAVALQANGKLVVAGGSFSADFGPGNLALARYNPDGSLDLSFGSGGRVLRTLINEDIGDTLAIQPDGKLLVTTFSFDDETVLNRFSPDGGIDESFGAGGRLIVDVSRVFSDFDSAFLDELVVLPNGKLVAGVAVGLGLPGDEFTTDFALARFNGDGSLDATFGSSGRVVIDFTQDSDVAPRDDSISSLIIQPDGKLVAVGTSNSADFADRKVALARFNPDGSLDPSFASGGRALLDLGGGFPSTLVLQPDGKLVALVFRFGFGIVGSGQILARFNADGSLDTSFGSGGLAQLPFVSRTFPFFVDLAVQSDGKLVVAGSLSALDFASSLFVLARLNADGSVDTGFGSGGQVLTSFDGRQLSSNNGANTLVVQSDGKLVVIGTSDASGDADFAVARYLAGSERPAQPPRCGGRRATMIGTPANDALRGTLFGRDVILGLGGNDTIRGLGSDDILCGGRGNDVLIGGDDSDRLDGGPGNDRLFGDLGLDSVDGDDALFGGPGRDTLVGAGGSDSLFGERDNDRLFGDVGQDTLDGGDGGRDRCRGGLGRDTTTGCEFGSVQRPAEPPRDPVPNPCPVVANTPGCNAPSP